MSKIYYPAVFHASDDNTGYWIEFPDLPGCFSQGDTINQSMEFAKEALGLFLDQSDDLYERNIAQPSEVQEVMKQFPNEIVLLVEYDSIKYARLYKNKAVKKTLSIPQWLNEEATAKGLNFSQILQEALISKLQSI